MTKQRDFKRRVRARMALTGESYAVARLRLGNERDAWTAVHDLQPTAAGREVEVAIIKLNQQSARIRLLDDGRDVTLRCPTWHELIPGQIATVRLSREWSFKGYGYASGAVLGVRTDVPALGLTPLPLEDCGEQDFSSFEPYVEGEPYADLWFWATARPRPSFEFNAIAWDAVAATTGDCEQTPVADAAELGELGEVDVARAMLMDVLAVDLRCIDAHAHLGNQLFEGSASRALVHYEIGKDIAELSLGPDFAGALLWGHVNNRPYLRCLHGYGLCLWRLGRAVEAERVFRRMFWLNPNDNQGARS